MVQLIGELGEKLVDRWLQLQEYQILGRRWRCRWGEIDLIACQKNSPLVAFIEIKTRNDRSWDAGGLMAIDRRKQAKIIKTADLFLAENPHLAEYPCRFDAAIVSYRKTKQKNNISLDRAIVKIAQSITIESGYELTLSNYLEGAFEVN